MLKKTITIKCKGADLLPYDSLIQFQGDLKTLSKKNLEKLKQQIIKKGFRMPFYIWKNKDKNLILDGSQRDKVLKSLVDDGYEIPLLPVVYIEADNKADAKETILAISSQYGEWNTSELDNWLENIDAEIKETLRFVDKEIEVSNQEDKKPKNETLTPYEKIHILISTDIKYIDRFNKLIEQIKNENWLEYEQSQN